MQYVDVTTCPSMPRLLLLLLLLLLLRFKAAKASAYLVATLQEGAVLRSPFSAAAVQSPHSSPAHPFGHRTPTHRRPSCEDVLFFDVPVAEVCLRVLQEPCTREWAAAAATVGSFLTR
jgi:hypothetical protein